MSDDGIDPRPPPGRAASRRAPSAPHRAARARPDADQRARSTRPRRSRRPTPRSSAGSPRTRAARLRLQPDRQPDGGRARRRRRRARRRRGGHRARVRDGRDPRGARVARSGRATGSSRRWRATGRPGPSCSGRSAGSASTSSFVDMTDLDAVEAALAAAPDPRAVRRDHRQPDDCVVADHAALAELAHRHGATLRRRQHVRLAVRLPAARARRRPRGRVGDQVPGRPQRRDRRRRRRLDGAHRRRRARPDRHRRDARAVRRVPRAARHPDARGPGRAPRRDRRGARRPGSSARTASLACSTRACRAIPQHAVAHAPVPAGRRRRDARLRARRRPRGRPRRHRRAAASRSGPPRSAASTRWSSTRPRRRTASRPRRSCWRPGITPGLLRVSVGLEDVEDLAGGLQRTRSPRRAPPPADPCRRSAPSRRPSHREPGVVRRPTSTRPSGRNIPARLGLRAVAPADVGRLRRRPDHRPGPAGGRRDDASSSCRTSRSARRPTTRPRWIDIHARYDPVARARRSWTRSSGCRSSRSSARPGSAPGSSCWSSRSSCARSTGRRGCGAASATSGSSSPSRTSTRAAGPSRDGRRGRRTTSARSCAATGSTSARRPRPTGRRYLYGDRHQYTKMATLFTHAGLDRCSSSPRRSTSRLGDEQGLVVAEGEVADRPADRHARPAAGPEHRLRGARFRDRPGRPTSRPTSPSTRTASRSRARRSGSTTRCRSRATRSTRTGSGRRRTSSSATAAGEPLWDAPGPDDRCGRRAAVRHRSASRAGTSASSCCSTRTADGTGGPDRPPVPRRRDRRPTGADRGHATRRSTCHRGDTRVSAGAGPVDRADAISPSYTLLIAKRDPGQGLVWIAFGLLIAGITITFYRPRRRVWTRLAPDGRLGIVWRSDRYVDVEREFGRLLDQLVAVRRPGA